MDFDLLCVFALKFNLISDGRMQYILLRRVSKNRSITKYQKVSSVCLFVTISSAFAFLGNLYMRENRSNGGFFYCALLTNKPYYELLSKTLWCFSKNIMMFFCEHYDVVSRT